ncbi:MAG TPA: hypothetical protein VL137_16300 [Polyangiaceae bacterium]|jgi:hypothetical protein|nr:hypothetical protein [Polyangiaceae bacterium]
MGSTVTGRLVGGLLEVCRVGWQQLHAAVLPLVFVAAVPLVAGCQSGGVGDPCVPEDEYSTTFSGFDEKEVNLERRSFQCETRVCLINHFRGRVTCPYGQNVPALGPKDGVAEGVDHSERCRIPGGTATELVQVPVVPQLKKRRAESTVYCSCRCAGPDKNANYCDCPGGFVCEELITNLGLGKEQLTGSYCVRSGTQVDNPTDISKISCSYTALDCGAGITQD